MAARHGHSTPGVVFWLAVQSLIVGLQQRNPLIPNGPNSATNPPCWRRNGKEGRQEQARGRGQSGDNKAPKQHLRPGHKRPFRIQERTPQLTPSKSGQGTPVRVSTILHLRQKQTASGHNWDGARLLALPQLCGAQYPSWKLCRVAQHLKGSLGQMQPRGW